MVIRIGATSIYHNGTDGYGFRYGRVYLLLITLNYSIVSVLFLKCAYFLENKKKIVTYTATKNIFYQLLIQNKSRKNYIFLKFPVGYKILSFFEEIKIIVSNKLSFLILSNNQKGNLKENS